MPPKKKPFFWSQDLKPWEKRVIYIYLVITITLCFWYHNTGSNIRQGILIGYAFITQISLYFGLYTSLRNLKSYVIWCCFGLFQLCVYFFIKDDPSLQMPRGNPATDLRNTIVLLLLFQILRYISLKLQNREFVAPAHGGGKDLFENKQPSFVDFIILIMYFASFAGLIALSLNFQ